MGGTIWVSYPFVNKKVNYTPNQEIGSRLRLFRKELRLSQAGFAEKIRYDRSNLSKIERGEIELSPVMRLLICLVFNVREDWILTGSGQKYNATELVHKKVHGLFDFDLMKEVIESVEEVFQRNNLSLPPKKKAELIGFVYEEIAENEEIKGSIPGRVLKLIKLAS